MREHELESLIEEEVAALQRRRARPQRGEQLGGLAGGRERDEHGDAGPQARRQLPAHASDDSERPLRTDEQVPEAVSGVVLGEPREPRDHRPVGEHSLEPGHSGACGPMTQRARPASVAGDDAPDRARVPGREVEPGVLVGRACRLLKRGERRSGAHRHLSEGRVDLLDRVEAGQRDHHLSAPRHPATDEPGIPALGHHRGAGLRARAHDGGHLGGVRGPHDEPRPPDVTTGVVALVGGTQLRVGDDVARPHGVR